MHDLNGLKVYHVEKGLVENEQTVLTLKGHYFPYGRGRQNGGGAIFKLTYTDESVYELTPKEVFG